MTLRQADVVLLDEYTRDLYQLRAWLLAEMRRGYARVDRNNLDASFVWLVPFLTGLTQVGVARSVEITGNYLSVFAALRGIGYSVAGGVRPNPVVFEDSSPLPPVLARLGDLVGSRPPAVAPQRVVGIPDLDSPFSVPRLERRVATLTSGRPTRDGFVKLPLGVKASIKRGDGVERALARSQGVSTTVVGSEAHRVAREMSVFQITDPSSPFTRWRRVPSPGACDFCLILATRGAVYRNAETAKRGHVNCRCVVEAAGIEGGRWSAIDPLDMLRTVSIKAKNGARYTYDLSSGACRVDYPGGRSYVGPPSDRGVGSSNMVELRPPPAFWERRAENRGR